MAKDEKEMVNSKKIYIYVRYDSLGLLKSVLTINGTRKKVQLGEESAKNG